MNIVQASRVGAREINEDRVGHWTAPGVALLAVADGLGGHQHGELAAEIAIEILGAAFGGAARKKIEDPADFLARTFLAAHAAIVREAERRALPETPRTVLAACVVQD
ncbi:MAG TPA: protein phosphatase 2C domain-containing protein, partial [Burkholderiales bacterium]|nr:protein phosphatase 2C domain-containing protein [Burkholderiales bacterium]